MQAEYTAGVGAEKTPVTLRAVPDQPGMYRGDFVALKAGRYRLSTEADPGTAVEFSASAPQFELGETAMNEGLLEQMAAISGGRFFREENLSGLAKELNRKARNPENSPGPRALGFALIFPADGRHGGDRVGVAKAVGLEMIELVKVRELGRTRAMKPAAVILLSLTYLLSLRAWSREPEIHGNPLVPDTIADPSIVCFDGTYYLYATTDTDKGLSEAGPPVVWKSKDFLNWSFDGILIPDVKWGKTRYWAPGKVIRKDDQYYLFVTVVNEKDNAKGYVATADKPEGPFHFAGGPPVFLDDPATGQKALKPLFPILTASHSLTTMVPRIFFGASERRPSSRRFAEHRRARYQYSHQARPVIPKGLSCSSARGFIITFIRSRACENYKNAYMMSTSRSARSL